MPEKPAAERTEQPTPRRLDKARESGQLPHSQELGESATLMALLLTLALWGPGLFRWCSLKMRAGLSCQQGPFTDSQAFIRFFNERIIDATIVTLPILAALLAAGVLSNIVVSGWTFSPQALKFKWNAINPASVMQNFMNPRTAVRLLMSIAKLCFVGLIIWVYLRDKLETLADLRWAWSVEIMTAIARITFGLGLRIGIAVLALGIADALYQKWQYIQELKMTRQEVKQERKDMEGSPEVKARIRRMQIEMSLKRLRREIPKASVILVNPTHVAVALQYEPRTMDAPILLAKGADHMAERIVSIARSYGIPIIRRPEAARAIYASVKPGQAIPESLYVAVAEVLAMLLRLRQKRKAARGG
jgi:flagellar biosynthetic protein FlhB